MRRLTEELPSSGVRHCNHVWKAVQNADMREGVQMLVCDKCGETKAVKKPVLRENQSDKKLLLG